MKFIFLSCVLLVGCNRWEDPLVTTEYMNSLNYKDTFEPKYSDSLVVIEGTSRKYDEFLYHTHVCYKNAIINCESSEEIPAKTIDSLKIEIIKIQKAYEQTTKKKT